MLDDADEGRRITGARHFARATSKAIDMTTLEDYRARDAQDPLRPLRPLRAQFALPHGVIYLDGNSLGVLRKTTAARVAHAVT